MFIAFHPAASNQQQATRRGTLQGLTWVTGAQVVASGLVLVSLAGCLERRLLITSDPPGATVTANDVELGRTPLEADMTFYGGYDVKVEKQGFEPSRQRANAATPIQEYPPLDLFATAAPWTISHTTRWNFTLTPQLESTQSPEELTQGVIARARELRGKINP